MTHKIIPGPRGEEEGLAFTDAAQEIRDANVYKPKENLFFRLGDKVKVAEFMRDIMGFDNKDTAGDRVNTQSITISGPNGDIPIYINSPQGENLPVMIYFHGGAWIGGTAGDVQNICRGIADSSGMMVVNVEYRLAPEHPYPAGLEDSYATLLWAKENIGSYGGDSEKIIMAGDSAGANFATLCCTLSHQRKGPAIAAQVLLYPAMDISRGCRVNPSVGPVPLRRYQIMKRLYLGLRSARNPMVSPVYAKDLSYMPPTLLTTTEFCFLRDQGEAYAQMLDSQGVPVTVLQYNGLNHAFLDKVGVWPQADQGVKHIAQYLKETI